MQLGEYEGKEGVCWRCGCKGHIAKNCIADMLEDVKWKVLNHAHIATVSEDDDDKPPIGMNAYQTIFALFLWLLVRHAKSCSLNQTFMTARAQSQHPKKPGHMSFHMKILSSTCQGET